MIQRISCMYTHLHNTGMRYLSSLMLLLLIPLASAQGVVVSQVLYDPLDESGGEAVELYNPSENDVDLSFAEIRSESQEADATLPNGTIIRALSYYLITDVGWETDKDNPNWPASDYEETLTFYNTDSGVALVIDGNIVDAVGWGNPAEIEEGLYEGSPANHTGEGSTLLRDTDTDDNSLDFSVDETPVFHAAGSQEEGTLSIEITATILGSEAGITGIYLPPDEDDNAIGVQYYPRPGEMKVLTIEAEVEDPDGVEGIGQPTLVFDGSVFVMELVENLSETSALFSHPLSIPFYQSPDSYLIQINLDQATANATFDILPVVGIDLDAVSLSFSSSIGSSMDVIGDDDMATDDRPTIQNIGNVQLDIAIHGSDFYSESDVLDLDSFIYTLFGSSFVGSLAGVLTSEPVVVPLGLEPGELSVNELSIRFEPLPNNLPGTYIGNIYLSGVAS